MLAVRNTLKPCGITALFMMLLFTELYSQRPEGITQFTPLANLTGTWDVSVEARLSASGPWESSEGTSVITKVVGGTVLEENFTGSRDGKPFIAKTLLAVNNLTGKLQRVFMDSEHGGAMIDFEGQPESENTFVYDKLWTYPNGNTVRLRVVYTIISSREFTLESMRMPQGTTEWDVSGKMKYKRKN
jgi:hypothetical protein